MATIPPYLKKGNTIGITCPSGFMDAKKSTACIHTLQKWGFNVMVGKTVGGKSTNYFSASDEDKIEELQAMLDSKEIHAILFGRGGYGLSRIIDKLSFKEFKKNPKWLIGFSDITVLHCHLLTNINIASVHGPMAGAFNTNNSLTIQSLYKTISGKKINYSCESYHLNRAGKVTGELIGGNLALLSNVIGTKSDFKTKNKILFIEDVGELLYSADRMLQQLKRSGKINQLAGLIVGGFTEMKDTERPFGKTIQEIIFDIVKESDQQRYIEIQDEIDYVEFQITELPNPVRAPDLSIAELILSA
jgi:muramoyltetrapeptide carboxypeptidase